MTDSIICETGGRSVATERKKDLRHFRELEVYQHGFAAAMKIFELTKKLPG